VLRELPAKLEHATADSYHASTSQTREWLVRQGSGVEEGLAMVGCIWKSNFDYHVMKWNMMEDPLSRRLSVFIY
jgi:hypothetical protein